MLLVRNTGLSALSLALIVASFCSASAGEGHGHEKWAFEAVYDIKEAAEAYSLNFANAAADSTMKFCFHLTDEASKHGVEEVESKCHADEVDANITAFGAAVNIASGTTYKMVMDKNSWLSVFNIKFPKNGFYALFTEHMPSEFKFKGGTDMEILKDGDKHDVKTAWASTDVAAAKKTTPWKDTMLGCLAVWVVSLTGLILIINSNLWETIKPYALMFGSGTLLSTAFALVLYESTHLITVNADEGLATGRWTAMIMCGFITAPIIALILRMILPEVEEQAEEKDIEKNKAVEKVVPVPDCCSEHIPSQDHCETSISNPNVRMRFLMSLIMGDFFHNFTDGIFIGAAFQCNTSLAWKIVAVTVGHEIPQELADFAVLTNNLGFSVPMALLYNVFSGISVMLGGMTIMAADVSSLDTGMLLAYGAGNYIYCATVHMFSQGSKNKLFDLKKLLVFAVGAIAIGLILLDHEHCTAPTPAGAPAPAADAHAGHAHHGHGHKLFR